MSPPSRQGAEPADGRPSLFVANTICHCERSEAISCREGRILRTALHWRLFPAKFAAMAKSTKRQIVGVVSQKGGVGKSTLCHLIAREAAAAGKQVKILDFDTKQMTSTDWVRARLERALEPAIEAEPAKNIGSALKHNRGYDIIILDGAAGTPKRTAALASACDLIVLPTGASRADLVPTLALARRIAG